MELKDADGNYFIREFQEIINTRKEGFTSYKWLNPSSGTIEDKLSYVFYFEPFDWIVGTGVYFKEVTRTKTATGIGLCPQSEIRGGWIFFYHQL